MSASEPPSPSPARPAEYVVGPDGRTGRRRDAHADDQNGVCVFCNLCIDLHCCGRLDYRCPGSTNGA